MITADGTKKDAAIYTDLARANRASLPTNLIYPANPEKPAIMMPEFLSPEIAIKGLRAAATMK